MALSVPERRRGRAAARPRFGVSLADIGILIGLYFTPGVALALPGGAIGQRFGDKATVLAALLLMLAGGLAMALSHSWSVQIAGRLVAGAGGVMLNVQMTKMVADWFAGREIATAMAIFVNSWPAGVAISLLTLPVIGTAYGVERGLSRGRGADRMRHRAACRARISRRRIPWPTAAATPRVSIATPSIAVIAAGADLGSLQCRLRHDLQLRTLDAGRARLVDHRGGIGHQHRAVADGVLGAARRLSRRPDRASRTRSSSPAASCSRC